MPTAVTILVPCAGNLPTSTPALGVWLCAFVGTTPGVARLGAGGGRAALCVSLPLRLWRTNEGSSAGACAVPYGLVP